jgi:hypothetical protein
MFLFKTRNSLTVNSPLVMVPVLSNAATLTLDKSCRTSPPLTRRPIFAALRSAQKVATGVDKTRAQGHALTKSTNASRNQCRGLCNLIIKGINATPADMNTTPAHITSTSNSDIKYYNFPKLTPLDKSSKSMQIKGLGF